VLVTRRAASSEEARGLAARVERDWPGLVRGAVHVADGAWTKVDGTPGAPPAGDVLAVCGVARPDAFVAAVRLRVKGAVELVAFADHHAYTREDAESLRRRAGGRTIVVTEKDAVKLAAMVAELGEAFVLQDRLTWDWGEESVRAWVCSVASEESRP
jgi:tetraacyldisaccharide-1-P 4'-kinase